MYKYSFSAFTKYPSIGADDLPFWAVWSPWLEKRRLGRRFGGDLRDLYLAFLTKGRHYLW